MLEIFNQRQFKRLHRSAFSSTNKAKLYSTLATLILIGIAVMILGTTALFAWYARDLPQPDKVVRREGFSTIIYDRNGQVLYDVFNNQNRIPVNLSEIPKYLQEATVSIEDKDFYKHQGFDPLGYLRAVKQIVINHSLAGGSTLTQQLVKNVLLTSERSIPRKIKEFILAVQIEKKYSKDQILQMYLNEAPYGGTAWGVESASQLYFGKHVKDLTLTECAFLAGLPQLPSVYSPYGSDPKAYIWRSEQVLRRMREDGHITSAQEKESDKELPNMKFQQGGGTDIKAAHFVMYIRQKLVEQFGEQMVQNGGLRVTTTLDENIQKQAEQIVKEEAAKLAPYKASNAAAVILNPQTGEILAMVGSKDYFDKTIDGNVNLVTSLRQPGSAGKPILYALALRNGYTPASLLMDVKTDFPSGNPDKPIYTPVNYDGKFHGAVQIRFALGNSINIPAVKMAALLGVKNVMELGYEMGISTWDPTPENLKNVGLSLALGGREVKMLDLAGAYGVFATGGIRHDPVSIIKVTNSGGQTLYEYHQTDGKRILNQDITFLISHILSDNNARTMEFGPNSYLVVPGKTVAVKTGTTDQKRDNWTFGYTPNVVVGTWVGNNDNSAMNQVITSGVTGAAPIWNRLMRMVLKDKPDTQFAKPDDVNAMQIDAFAGGLPVGGEPTRSEYFIKGTEPTGPSPVYQTLKISKNDPTKLANPVEIAAGDYTEKQFFVFKENDPVSTDGQNRWQQGIDEWANSQSDDRYHVPKETSGAAGNRVVIKIKSPSDQSQINSNDVSFDASSVSSHDVIRMELLVDGNVKNSVSGSTYGQTVHLDSGPHEIKIRGTDSAGNQGDTTIRIGVNVPYNYVTPSPTPTPTLIPTATPTP
ncbi:MAG: PBP1A family penicillin-binding protein [Patescibacteria group bacterium]|nr:PBP1A family penicillin-binding protein [Patescibacteria group bacterium]